MRLSFVCTSSHIVDRININQYSAASSTHTTTNHPVQGIVSSQKCVNVSTSGTTANLVRKLKRHVLKLTTGKLQFDVSQNGKVRLLK